VSGFWILDLILREDSGAINLPGDTGTTGGNEK
jgi:hypothetical protein